MTDSPCIWDAELSALRGPFAHIDEGPGLLSVKDIEKISMPKPPSEFAQNAIKDWLESTMRERREFEAKLPALPPGYVWVAHDITPDIIPFDRPDDNTISYTFTTEYRPTPLPGFFPKESDD